MDLNADHIAKLEQMRANGFEIVAFPMYATYIGLRKANCAALVEPLPDGQFKIIGRPCVLIGQNFSVRVRQSNRDYFVWKQEKLEATPRLLQDLAIFSEELQRLLA